MAEPVTTSGPVDKDVKTSAPAAKPTPTGTEPKQGNVSTVERLSAPAEEQKESQDTSTAPTGDKPEASTPTRWDVEMAKLRQHDSLHSSPKSAASPEKQKTAPEIAPSPQRSSNLAGQSQGSSGNGITATEERNDQSSNAQDTSNTSNKASAGSSAHNNPTSKIAEGKPKDATGQASTTPVSTAFDRARAPPQFWPPSEGNGPTAGPNRPEKLLDGPTGSTAAVAPTTASNPSEDNSWDPSRVNALPMSERKTSKKRTDTPSSPEATPSPHKRKRVTPVRFRHDEDGVEAKKIEARSRDRRAAKRSRSPPVSRPRGRPPGSSSRTRSELKKKTPSPRKSAERGKTSNVTDGTRQSPRRAKQLTKELRSLSPARKLTRPTSARELNKRRSPASASPKEKEKLYKEAKSSLCALPSLTEEEVVEALEAVGPPYGLQRVMKYVQDCRDGKIWNEPDTLQRFHPGVGFKVRKMFDGREYHGRVTKEAETVEWAFGSKRGKKERRLMWEVTFSDGDKEDMDLEDLFRCRASRPIAPAPCRGRQLQCLELFPGRGIVSQEFVERKWRVATLDNDASVAELPFVPDFIWASPPFPANVTAEDASNENDKLFLRMAEILHWAKQRHPHLIVVMENPIGLREMPLTKELEKSFGLHRATVDYCAFGRQDKKSTDLWTNDWDLCVSLREFTCENKCPRHCGPHEPSDMDEIVPQAMAEEIGAFIDAKFYMERIRYRSVSNTS